MQNLKLTSRGGVKNIHNVSKTQRQITENIFIFRFMHFGVGNAECNFEDARPR